MTSIGIDLGSKLTHWHSRLVEAVSFELNDSRDARPFLITEKIPQHGRSGGGLFLPGGELVGVCIGHSELVKGKRMGVFAAAESIRRLLDEQELTETVLRSERRMARLKRDRSPTPPAGRACARRFAGDANPLGYRRTPDALTAHDPRRTAAG